MIIPGGLSSEAVVKEDKFCVQTEFAHRPKPRVTTTISLNGEVVEKVENPWDRSPHTDEDREEIEIFLKRQHQQVLETIKNKGEKPASPEPEKEEVTPAVGDELSKVDRELYSYDGVCRWISLMEDGRMSTRRISGSEDEDIKEQVKLIKDLALFLTTVTRLGNLVGGVLHLAKGFLLLLPLHHRLLAVQLDPKVDVKSLVKRIKSVV
jgi:hypothetical protein